jgi:hypothetical protein
VISTVGDLAKWAIALQEGKVLKRATISEMWKPVRLGNGDPAWVAHWGYGFGWFLMTFNGHPIVQHGGASGTNLTILPAQKTSVIVLTNLEQAAGGDATGLAEEIYKLYHPELGWTALKAKPDPSGFAAKLKDEIVRLSEGKMDESLYSEAYGKLIKTILPQQKAGLPRFGALDSVDLLFEDKAGKELVSGYRLTFKEVTLYGSVRRNAAGKIEFFAIQGE